MEFCQDNESMSSYSVMRGLHFQKPPFIQSKLVRCVKGRVIIIPSFFTLKEGSTFLTKPLFPPVREDVTALRCSEPLRSKVGGPKRSSPWLCGMGPPVVGGIQMGRMYQGSLRTSLLQDEDGNANAKVGKVICSTI